MPRISAQEFAHLPLRVHGFLADVPLHDVWAVDLPRTRSGITLDEFLRAEKIHQCRLSPSARALLSVRLSIGRLFGWDRAPAATACETFATRITTVDCSNTLVPTGAPDGLFRVVYRFENEQLLELINRTAHAAALSALVETKTPTASISQFTCAMSALLRRSTCLSSTRSASILSIRRCFARSARRGTQPSARPDALRPDRQISKHEIRAPDSVPEQ